MKPMDQAFLMLVGSAFVVAVILFFYLRSRGNSRSWSTAKATMALGAVVAIGFFVFTEHLVRSRSGMGLEKFVVPPIIFLASVAVAAILGMLVYMLENLKAPAAPHIPSSILPQDGASPLSASTQNDWRAFAKEASQQH